MKKICLPYVSLTRAEQRIAGGGLMSYLPRNPIIVYYASHWLYTHHIPVLPVLIQWLLYFLCHAVVPFRAEIGPGCLLAHGGSGVVVHSRARIGRNVMISQQVTIGGSGHSNALPVIGDNVYLGAGAKILGPVTIGNNSVIGANAVVVKSIPSRCVAVGVPARVIRENVDARDVERW